MFDEWLECVCVCVPTCDASLHEKIYVNLEEACIIWSSITWKRKGLLYFIWDESPSVISGSRQQMVQKDTRVMGLDDNLHVIYLIIFIQRKKMTDKIFTYHVDVMIQK